MLQASQIDKLEASEPLFKERTEDLIVASDLAPPSLKKCRHCGLLKHSVMDFSSKGARLSRDTRCKKCSSAIRVQRRRKKKAELGRLQKRVWTTSLVQEVAVAYQAYSSESELEDIKRAVNRILNPYKRGDE